MILYDLSLTERISFNDLHFGCVKLSHHFYPWILCIIILTACEVKSKYLIYHLNSSVCIFYNFLCAGLRKKTVRGAPPQADESNVVSRVNNELFGEQTKSPVLTCPVLTITFCPVMLHPVSTYPIICVTSCVICFNTFLSPPFVCVYYYSRLKAP